MDLYGDVCGFTLGTADNTPTVSEGFLMPIDIQTERLITLDEAAALVPGRDEGKRVHPITVGLWTRRGKRGILLESVLAGTRKCTSVEALTRFFDRLSAAPSGQEPRTVSARSRREAARAVKQAVAELAAAGA